MIDGPLSFDEIVSRFRGPRKPNGQGGYLVRCPAHADDDPSLSVSPGNGSGPLFKCHGGCDTESVLTAAGLTWQDVLPPKEAPRKPAPAKASRDSAVITVSDLARDKGLPADFLRSLGLEDRPDGVHIPYRLMDGSPAPRQRLRKALSAKEGSSWLPGAGSPVPYGLDRLEDAQERGFLLLVEGESDCWTLWNRGYPALGIPGADMGGKIEKEHLAGIDRVFFWREPDRGGDTFAQKIPARLREIGFVGEIREVRIDGVKDPQALYQSGPEDFDRIFGKALDEAHRLTSPEKQGRPLLESVSVLLEDPSRPTWFVEGRIETPSSGMIFGASGAGKSFVALDLSMEAATGGQWAGLKVHAPGFVVYMAGEGRAALLRRIKAWEIDHKTKIPDGRLYVSAIRLPLDEEGEEKLGNAIADRVQEMGKNPSLIVVDTLARHMRDGGNENSTADMNEFINRLDRLRDRFGCVVLIVHHTGHTEQDRARGASSNKAAMDTEIRVSKRGGSRVMEWTKMRDCPDDPAPQEFTLKPALIDATEDGEFVRSAVVAWKGAMAKSTRVEMTKAEALGMETLRLAIEKDGGFAASTDAWRETFYSRHWGDNAGAKKKAFGRIRESLVGKELIQVRDDRYSIRVGGQGDKGGHCPDLSPGEGGQTGTHPLGVSPCPPLSREEEAIP